ncbi:hypothetical protein Zmor_002485 [Zophobas morio]|uniref:Uncharacterized protein n=1 Tax=Zophobas morio TaxID=2755281 RepID=A0AA38J0M8_9CUCU|nr:hypothetical protein Zmor_002485 [Zophobas morio]
MKRPIPTSTLLRFPLLFGGFLAVVGLGLSYKESWLGDVEGSRNKILGQGNLEANPIHDFKKEVAAKIKS